MRALVRMPSSRLAEGAVTHIERTPVDTDLAVTQWQDYCRAMTDAGWGLIEVPIAPELPDSGFVEDTMVVHGNLAIIANPGSDHRSDEVIGAREVISSLGYDVISLQDPARLDGGDVLKVGDVWYVGQGGRTNPAGIAALRHAVAPRGVRVVAVPLTKALHLKSAVTALPDGTIIGYQPIVDDSSFFPHFVAMPEEGGAHVVDLGDGRLLMSTSAPRSTEEIIRRGYTPVLVDITEFEKLEGCVTCLSVRLRG